MSVRSSRSWFAVAFAAAMLPLALNGTASADARFCRQLQAELSSLGSRGGRAAYQRYDRAVTEQRQEIRIARQRARAGGCRFAFGLGGAQCDAINGKIEAMEANLADLQRKRSVLAKGVSGGAPRERARLLAALDANDCAAARRKERLAALGRPAEQDGSLFDRLGRGSFEYVDPPPPDSGEGQGGDHSARAYRTMCVRTCDGYYFPMSPASSRDDFARDQQNCESICPGTEIRTYYQRSGVENVDTMMSAASEEPYSELSTAYLYRRADVERPPACGCERLATQQNFSIIAGEGSAAEETREAAEPVIPAPSARPDQAADPETLANADGGLDRQQITEMLKPKFVKKTPAGERKVRVVGPAFLPAPAAAASPPVPDQRRAR